MHLLKSPINKTLLNVQLNERETFDPTASYTYVDPPTFLILEAETSTYSYKMGALKRK